MSVLLALQMIALTLIPNPPSLCPPAHLTPPPPPLNDLHHLVRVDSLLDEAVRQHVAFLHQHLLHLKVPLAAVVVHAIDHLHQPPGHTRQGVAPCRPPCPATPPSGRLSLICWTGLLASSLFLAVAHSSLPCSLLGISVTFTTSSCFCTLNRHSDLSRSTPHPHVGWFCC